MLYSPWCFAFSGKDDISGKEVSECRTLLLWWKCFCLMIICCCWHFVENNCWKFKISQALVNTFHLLFKFLSDEQPHVKMFMVHSINWGNREAKLVHARYIKLQHSQVQPYESRRKQIRPRSKSFRIVPTSTHPGIYTGRGTYIVPFSVVAEKQSISSKTFVLRC